MVVFVGKHLVYPAGVVLDAMVVAAQRCEVARPLIVALHSRLEGLQPLRANLPAIGFHIEVAA